MYNQHWSGEAIKAAHFWHSTTHTATHDSDHTHAVCHWSHSVTQYTTVYFLFLLPFQLCFLHPLARGEVGGRGRTGQAEEAGDVVGEEGRERAGGEESWI